MKVVKMLFQVRDGTGPCGRRLWAIVMSLLKSLGHRRVPTTTTKWSYTRWPTCSIRTSSAFLAARRSSLSTARPSVGSFWNTLLLAASRFVGLYLSLI